MGCDKDSFIGKAKAMHTNKERSYFTVSQMFSHPFCHAYWWFGKTNAITSNIHLFLLLPLALYVEYDTVLYGISLWSTEILGSSAAAVSPSCALPALTGGMGWGAEKALVVFVSTAQQWNIPVLSSLLPAQIQSMHHTSYCEENYARWNQHM